MTKKFHATKGATDSKDSKLFASHKISHLTRTEETKIAMTCKEDTGANNCSGSILCYISDVSPIELGQPINYIEKWLRRNKDGVLYNISS